jgi:hypothetical protein
MGMNCLAIAIFFRSFRLFVNSCCKLFNHRSIPSPPSKLRLALFFVSSPIFSLSNNQIIGPCTASKCLHFYRDDKGSSTLDGSLLFSNEKTLVNKWFNQLQLNLRVTQAKNLQLNQLKVRRLILSLSIKTNIIWNGSNHYFASTCHLICMLMTR